MNINNISPVNFDANKIFIPRNVQGNCLKDRPYLYNEMVDLLKGKSLTALFKNEGIEVSNPTKKFIEEIKSKGIKFDEIV